ncbi:hypothetical protein EVAR_99381_1 [Eumeta japonica]|uniref:Uncharacterized protein n=1 Tax=Eumeta variegata TaxID=151549 RepID=A0A4C1YS12_EUMVA|nr:hypothetical protein EVAR_99381_1 [Eumeta japonica]
MRGCAKNNARTQTISAGARAADTAVHAPIFKTPIGRHRPAVYRCTYVYASRWARSNTYPIGARANIDMSVTRTHKFLRTQKLFNAPKEGFTSKKFSVNFKRLKPVFEQKAGRANKQENSIQLQLTGVQDLNTKILKETAPTAAAPTSVLPGHYIQAKYRGRA